MSELVSNETVKRFNAAHTKTTTCWLWNKSLSGRGWKTGDGYGSLLVNKKHFRANRLSWLIHRGDIPDGAFVCHTCDVKRCVNPDHLYLGNTSTNLKDTYLHGRPRVNRGLVKTWSNRSCKQFCVHGHPRIAENMWLKANGGYDCRICREIRNRSRKEEHRAYRLRRKLAALGQQKEKEG